MYDGEKEKTERETLKGREREKEKEKDLKQKKIQRDRDKRERPCKTKRNREKDRKRKRHTETEGGRDRWRQRDKKRFDIEVIVNLRLYCRVRDWCRLCRLAVGGGCSCSYLSKHSQLTIENMETNFSITNHANNQNFESSTNEVQNSEESQNFTN